MVFCAALMLGCTEAGDESTPPTTDTADTADTTVAPSDTATASQPETEGETAATGAPLFLTFNSNTQTLPSDGVLVFTAILTHPDGVSQVIGGTLLDPGTGSSYGAFITQATQGTYTLSLTWSQINTVAAINAPPDGAPRTFRATFFDQRGHEASRDLAIQLVCAPASYGACAGECVDLASSNQHCGACNVAAVRCNGGTPACTGSDTLCASGCKQLDGDVYNCGACDAECPKHDFGITRSCEERRCGFYVDSYVPITCADLCAKHSGECRFGLLFTSDGMQHGRFCDQADEGSFDSEFGSMRCACWD